MREAVGIQVALCHCSENAAADAVFLVLFMPVLMPVSLVVGKGMDFQALPVSLACVMALVSGATAMYGKSI